MTKPVKYTDGTLSREIEERPHHPAEGLEFMCKENHENLTQENPCTKESDDLLPCPFCGGKARLLGGPCSQEAFEVWCENQHRGKSSYSEFTAVATNRNRAKR
ncbi:MAG: hypothetical protein IAE63_00025 [Alphaproteobacteria bacterium]|nr:hypothetical protein [Alphaproteobacteria bacterium]